MSHSEMLHSERFGTVNLSVETIVRAWTGLLVALDGGRLKLCLGGFGPLG